MIILIILAMFILFFLLSSAILLLTSKIFKEQNRSFKKSMLIVLWTLICSGVMSFIFSLIETKSLSNLLVAIISFLIFHYFYKKYYSTSWKKSLGIFLVYSIISTIVALIVIIPVRTFLFTPFYVKGDSMSPTYQNNDYLFVSLFNKKFSKEDIVIVRKKDKPNTFLIKRIVATPGETIDTTTLNDQQYFVLSDNRKTNVDNGVIEESEIFGKVVYKAWPISGINANKTTTDQLSNPGYCEQDSDCIAVKNPSNGCYYSFFNKNATDAINEFKNNPKPMVMDCPTWSEVYCDARNQCTAERQ